MIESLRQYDACDDNARRMIYDLQQRITKLERRLSPRKKKERVVKRKKK